MMALFGQKLGYFQTNALTCTGDKGNFIVVFHFERRFYGPTL
jgi:hypothetical protein